MTNLLLIFAVSFLVFTLMAVAGFVVAYGLLHYFAGGEWWK